MPVKTSVLKGSSGLVYILLLIFLSKSYLLLRKCDLLLKQRKHRM
jgi:hypothetical protein